MNTTSRFRAPRRLLATVFVVLLAACGSDGDPTSPVGDQDDVDRPGWNDSWPELPRPDEYATPADIPSASESVVVAIEDYDGLFAPVVTAMRANYRVYIGDGDTKVLDQTAWSDALPSELSHVLVGGILEDTTPFAVFGDDPVRFRLANDGQTYDLSAPVEGAENGDGIAGFTTVSWPAAEGELFGERLRVAVSTFASSNGIPRPAEAPKVKRELLWRRLNLNAGETWAILGAGDSYSVSTTYTVGVDSTTSYEFGRSVTATVGGSYGPVSAEVSVTLSETFGESITISRQEETSYQTTVNAGDTSVIITLWQLVERFSFSDAEGEPYAVPGIEWPELVVEAPRASYLAKDPYLGN